MCYYRICGLGNKMIRDVSSSLPACLRARGLILTVENKKPIEKYVLTDRDKTYRSFIYLREGYDRETDEGNGLKDLFANYLFVSGLSIIEKENNR